jgi:large subunit ribosomal protein L18e
MKRTGPTNENLQHLIKELKKVSLENKAPIWKRIALELERPSRQRRSVNLYHIDKHVEDGDVIVVPGKVLATGELKKHVKIAAWSFSEQAANKIKDAISIHELLKENPKGKNVRIIG